MWYLLHWFSPPAKDRSTTSCLPRQPQPSGLPSLRVRGRHPRTRARVFRTAPHRPGTEQLSWGEGTHRGSIFPPSPSRRSQFGRTTQRERSRICCRRGSPGVAPRTRARETLDEPGECSVWASRDLAGRGDPEPKLGTFTMQGKTTRYASKDLSRARTLDRSIRRSRLRIRPMEGRQNTVFRCKFMIRTFRWRRPRFLGIQTFDSLVLH